MPQEPPVQSPPADSPAAPTGPAAAPSEDALVEIPVESLQPDPFQPRLVFKDETVRELARSIEQHGMLQPLLVRPMQGPDSQGRYWIVAGERRYRAAQLLGMKTLPCRIRPYENMAAAVIAIAENVHREDLSEIDKAAALLRLKTLTDRTWDEVAEMVKLSRDYVKRLAGLLRLEPFVQELLRSGQVSIRTAIALRPLLPRRQVEMAERVVAEGLTAEQVREEVHHHRTARGRTAQDDSAEASVEEAGPRIAGHGTVAQRLEDCARAVAEIDEWLEGRDWAPGRVTKAQQEAVERLYAAASALQQQLLSIRQPLREKQVPEAEKLRRARLPF